MLVEEDKFAARILDADDDGEPHWRPGAFPAERATYDRWKSVILKCHEKAERNGHPIGLETALKIVNDLDEYLTAQGLKEYVGDDEKKIRKQKASMSHVNRGDDQALTETLEKFKQDVATGIGGLLTKQLAVSYTHLTLPTIYSV